jgi:hypothetical protein
MPTTYGPTEKQVTFLRKLLAERHEGADLALRLRQLEAWLPNADKAAASHMIERVMARPKLVGATAEPTAPKGCTGRNIYELAKPGDLAYVPEGHYATPSATGNNDLDFWRVDRPTEGRWAGRVFVKRVIGGRADQAVRGAEAIDALRAICADHPHHAMVLYGQEVGRCGRCNRHLTDEASRQRGLGPDCAQLA